MTSPLILAPDALPERPIDGLLPEWRELYESLPSNQELTAAAVAGLCPWWRRSQGQLAHALRTMADRGVLAKPRRGVFIKQGSIEHAQAQNH